MVEISLSGSGEGPGRAISRGYSTTWVRERRASFPSALSVASEAREGRTAAFAGGTADGDAWHRSNLVRGLRAHVGAREAGGKARPRALGRDAAQVDAGGRLWQTRRERRKRAQQPRRRRACVGDLVQIDGSDHLSPSLPPQPATSIRPVKPSARAR